jgi:hypothetical protein
MKPVFLTRKKDGCCSVCNPVRLADVECNVVEVTSPLTSRKFALCVPCITALHRSARGERRVTITLHDEVQDFALEKERRKKVG